MNTLLGGSFTSRLNDNLREQHGYAYGAGSRFRRNLAGGLFFVATDVQTDKTGPALAEVFKELDRILHARHGRGGRARAQLRRARLRRATSRRRARSRSAWSTSSSTACPTASTRRSSRRRSPPTSPGLQKAARTAIDPKRLAVVVVGDRAKVEAPLRALNLGTLRVLSVDDVMGKAPDDRLRPGLYSRLPAVLVSYRYR